MFCSWTVLLDQSHIKPGNCVISLLDLSVVAILNKPKKTNKINIQLNYLEGFEIGPKDAAWG